MKGRSLLLAKAVVFGTLAAFFCAIPANASGPSVYGGKFTLTTAVQWGQAMLPAGNYSFTLDSATNGGVVTVRGESQTVLIIARMTDTNNSSQHSSLLIVRHNGSAWVRAMHLAELGMDFYYAQPKRESPSLAHGPELIQRVPIAVAGK